MLRSAGSGVNPGLLTLNGRPTEGAALRAAPPRPGAETEGSPAFAGFQAFERTARPLGEARVALMHN
eukprot:15475358-Alexandrium_andersonii.AAC.1